MWDRERRLRSFFLCLLPAAILLFGIYLTNSRGALLGLGLLMIFLLKDRMGTKASAIISPLAIVAVLALNQSGRAMSMDEDSALGRVNAWSDGLGMFQRSPLWGIGYNLFLQYHERTAHNSFVLCLSELGLMGTFLWLGLIVSSVQHLQALPQRIKFPKLAIARWSFALRASLYTVLATSWFLSRTYSSCFYIILALAFALSVLNGERESLYDPDGYEGPPKARWVVTTLLVLPVLIGAVYVTVRMRGL
jgi:O-antigen ligase